MQKTVEVLLITPVTFGDMQTINIQELYHLQFGLNVLVFSLWGIEGIMFGSRRFIG